MTQKSRHFSGRSNALTEDDVGVAGGVLVDVGLVDDEEDVLGLPDGDARHAGDLLQPQLGHDLPRLLLAPRLLRLAHQVLGEAGCCRDRVSALGINRLSECMIIWMLSTEA